jgi:peptidoglycan/LPS O-acetylase OafA/YrhL
VPRLPPSQAPHWPLPLIAAALILPPVVLWVTLGPWAGGATLFILAAALVVVAVRSDPSGLPSLGDRRRAERREQERRHDDDDGDDADRSRD